MSALTLKDLLLVPDNQIDYASLDDGLLEQLATQREEPFLATSALGELTQRPGTNVRDVAEQIVRADVWDTHLTAYALTLLFDRDPAGAIEHMVRLIEGCEDVTLLEAMAENVLNEPSRFENLQGFVRVLVAKLRPVADQLFDPDVLSRLSRLP